MENLVLFQNLASRLLNPTAVTPQKTAINGTKLSKPFNT
jgi:hypothetical protein